MQFLNGKPPVELHINGPDGAEIVDTMRGLLLVLPWIGHVFIGTLCYGDYCEFGISPLGVQ